ncbi:MAG TPA: SMP-30/gluconolactonase/LRE family protein [Candidatus Acidoferrum sp.]|nr:SMP-30/gluconolactonase/LRE family protein [Candidatus Acidoferrum sp.]
MTIIPNSGLDRFSTLMRTVFQAACFRGLVLGGLLQVALQNAGAVKFSISDAAKFTNLVNTNAAFITNVTINSKIEGPVWIPNGQYLLFSDMGNNKLKKLVPPGTLTDFLLPPAKTIYNGNYLDLQERQLSCECGSNGLQVVITTNGVATPLVTSYYGLKFYSPNDLTVKSDGSIWFTDPGYDSGLPLPPPSGPSVPAGFQPGLYVYRFYETNGNATVSVVATTVSKPNGICFSPDETKLYVADNGIYANSGIIRVFNVTSSNTLTGGSVFCTVSTGIADGIRCDVAGNIWAASGDGVEIYAPDGHLIGKIVLNTLSNICFGGPEYKTIYMTGQPNVCSFPVLVAGAVSIKKLRVSAAGTNLCVSWPAPSTGFGLQKSDSLGNGAVWTSVTDTLQVTNGLNQLSVFPTNAATFFRLLLN